MHIPPIVAAVIYVVGIVGLFWLDREPQAQTSKALWIPTAWLMAICSRPVSMWLGMSPAGGTANVYVEGSPIDAAMFLALVSASLVVVIARKEQVGPILRGNWPILLFFVYAGYSILWSEFPFVTFKHWVKGVGDVLIVLVVLTEPNLTDALKRLITRVGFVLLPLSVLCCKYYPAVGRGLTNSWSLQWRGVTMGKNELGGVCIVFGLGLLWRFRTAYRDREVSTRRGRLVALGTVLAMVVWLLWKCRSMTSICALAIASTVMLLSDRPVFRRRPALVHVVVALLLTAILYALFFQTSGSLLEGLGKDPTLTGRTEIWTGVLSVPVNRLVGAGYESFWLGQRLQEVWARFPTMMINEAHNGYLEMYLNLGWIGVSLLTGILVFGYRNVKVVLRRSPEIGGLYLGWLLSASIRGLTEAAFRMLSNSWFFLLFAVMAASQLALSNAEEPATDHDDLPEYETPLPSAPVPLLDRS